MKTLITAHYVEHPHHGCAIREFCGSLVLISHVGFWTPDVHPLEEGPTEWPCATELGAIKLGRELVAEGKAEV